MKTCVLNRPVNEDPRPPCFDEENCHRPRTIGEPRRYSRLLPLPKGGLSPLQPSMPAEPRWIPAAQLKSARSPGTPAIGHNGEPLPSPVGAFITGSVWGGKGGRVIHCSPVRLWWIAPAWQVVFMPASAQRQVPAEQALVRAQRPLGSVPHHAPSITLLTEGGKRATQRFEIRLLGGVAAAHPKRKWLSPIAHNVVRKVNHYV